MKKRVLSGFLACVLSFSLFVPVDIVRGQEAHTHTDACYQLLDEQKLVCGLEEAHEHTTDCYEEELFCGMSEHVHDENCYVQDLLCGQDEHVHSADCYDIDGNLICGQPEHMHSDVCYGTAVLVCDIPEHEHRSDCYTKHLACDMQEAHIHDSICYDADGNLICGKTERPVHAHTDSCYDLIDGGYSDVPLCGLEETEQSDSVLDDLGDIVNGLLTPGDAADYELVVHAVDVNDTEVYTESISVFADETIAEALSDSVLSDESGVLLADCGWYDADGESVDISSGLSGDTDIWTYQRMIGLTVGLDFYSILKWDSAESVTAADFVRDGTDFGAAYSWYDDETYDTVYLGNFVGQFLTSNVYLTTPDVEIPCYDVYYHDIGPDGEELPGAVDVLVSDYLPDGSTLQERGSFVLEDYWGDTAEEGGIFVGDCVWYREDGSVFDTVTGEEHVYTYSYTLTLITDDGRLTLTAREGFSIDASRLIADGIDYGSYSYQNDAGKAIDMSQLLASGLTGNLTLTQISDESDRPVEDITVNHYVYVNGVKTKVATTTQAYGPDTENFSGRYYLTLDQLAEIYGPYGFQPDEFSGQLIFPHTDIGSNTVWADVSPVYDNTGTWLIPIGKSRNSFDMYYFPNNVQGSSTYFNNSTSLRQTAWDGTQQDTAMTKSNYLYQVQVTDVDGLFENFEDEVHYVLSGHDLSLTVPYRAGVAWVISDNIDTVRELNDDKTQLAIYISDISKALSVTACEGLDDVNTFRIVYDTNIDAVVIAPNVPVSCQTFVEPFVVNGLENYADVIDFSDDTFSYTFLSMDNDMAIVDATLSVGFRQYYYFFDYWKLNDGTIVYPGDVMTLAELRPYAENNRVTVTPVFHVKDSNNRVKSLNFFVCLNCEIMDTSGSGFHPQPVGSFTESVHSTPIYGTENLPGNGSSGYQFVAAESEDTAYDVDKQIRSLVDEGIDGVTLGSVPTDEEVLRKIRESGVRISLDGEVISSDELTPDNFSVRWYVVKYESGDGWHIDGVLVARAGKMVVTKTFAGDDEAIAQVKQNYSISVERDGQQDYQLSLYPQTADSSVLAGSTGYTSYDSNTNTYTWVLDMRQSFQYTVYEQEYIAYPETRWRTSASYRVLNSDAQSSVEHAYTDAGVTVSVLTYASDAPATAYQTVALTNTYTQSGMLAVHKIDAATGNGMPGVIYDMYYSDYAPLMLYHKPGTYYYSAKDTAFELGYTELVTENNPVQTDNNGYFWLELPAGTYWLQESCPDGYDAPGVIEIQVTDDGSVEMTRIVIGAEGIEPSGGWIETQDNGMTLVIKNCSKRLTTVRVEKDWGLTEEPHDVVVELWGNGAKLSGAAYTVTLSAANDWCYEWYDLPLFMNQALTEYTVREVKIGDTPYDGGADTDGYQDYQVVVDDVLYREDDSVLTEHGYWIENDVIHYANYALIRIHNRETTGAILFQKTDTKGTPLAGAVFGLYADVSCTQLLEEATSDFNGKVEFMSRVAGTYYLRELSAPSGYAADDTVYTVQISGGQAKILNQAGDVVTKLVNEESDFLLEELPHTGSVSMLVCMVCGGTSLMAGLLLYSGKKKRV